jgi:hypothetical protein
LITQAAKPEIPGAPKGYAASMLEES